MAASTAMVNASGSAVRIISKLMDGRWNDGRRLLMVYRSPMVLTFRGRNLTIRIPTITAINDPGIFLAKYGAMIRTARLTRPTITAWMFRVEIFWINASSFSIVSIGFTPSG